jgi:hypothetical protein
VSRKFDFFQRRTSSFGSIGFVEASACFRVENLYQASSGYGWLFRDAGGEVMER